MTTKYQSYLQAINEGTIDLNDVNFSCHCVGEYLPDENHTLADVTDILSTTDEVLTGNCILTDSMSQIVDKIQSKINITKVIDGVETTTQIEGMKFYVVFSGETLCFCEGVE